MASGKPCDGTTSRKTHPALRDRFYYCFVRTTMQLKGELAERMAPLRLSPPGFLILAALETSGPSPQNALARSMGIDQASMVRFVDALEEEGFLQRLPDKNDRRARLLSATPAGRRARLRAEALAAEVEADFFAELSAADKRRWHEMLCRLLERREATESFQPVERSRATRSAATSKS